MKRKLSYLPFISLFVIILLGYFIYYTFKEVSNYNQTPLSIITPDGSNQPIHPSVIYCKDSWNGYKYWMAISPFPIDGKPYRDRYEYPCVYASNDGKIWEQLSSFSNPLDDLTIDEENGLDYFSDPELILVNDSLECWYRFTKRYGDMSNNVYTNIYNKKLAQGTGWSERNSKIDNIKIDTLLYLSPSLLYENNKYKLWYVAKNRKVRYEESIDSQSWNEPKECKLNGLDNYQPWHIDITKIDSFYFMISYNKDLTLWKSKNGYDFDYVKTLLEPSNIRGSFYSDGLYRSSMIKDINSVKLYFTANNGKKVCIGMMEGNSPETLKVISINGENESALKMTKFYLIDNFKRYYYNIKVKIYSLLSTFLN